MTRARTGWALLVTEVKQKYNVLLGYNKNYTALAFNYILKNSKGIFSVWETGIEGKSKDIIKD